MSEYGGKPGQRTRYTASIELTAREKQAVERFLSRDTVEGDVALVESVMRAILLAAVIDAKDPNPPTTDLHRE